MRELLEEHIKVIFIESTNNCGFLNRYLSHLSEHKHLTISDITANIKKEEVYTSTIMMADATVDIVIKGYYDYHALFNNVSISYKMSDDDNKESIENLFGLSLDVVLKHLTIKHIFNENNPHLISILANEIGVDKAISSDYVIKHSLNNPSYAYKGSVVFEKDMQETRKSVAKRWYLIDASEAITHEGNYTGVWLALKVIKLREHVEKTFYKITEDPREAIKWLATPLALRDPSLSKMLFDMKTSPMAKNLELSRVLIDMEPCDLSPAGIIDDNEAPTNLIPLNMIKARFLDTSSDIKPFVEPYQQNTLGLQGINPYTIGDPRSILDSKQENKSIRFETGNINNKVEPNEPDKYIFDGWLVAYINSKEDRPVKAGAVKLSGTVSRWFELFVFKTDDCYYVTKVNRSSSRLYSVKASKKRKVENIRNVGSTHTTEHQDINEILDVYGVPKVNRNGVYWVKDALSAQLI